MVDVTARPGVSAAQLEAAAAAELDRLVADGVTEGEVARAMALLESDFVQAMQSAGDRADKLSMFATLCESPARLNDEVSRYRAVTAAEVTAFARARLGPDNRASLMYVPKEAAA